MQLTQRFWHYAGEHGYAIVTKDAGFRQRSFLEGHPPKITWVRLGNCTTKTVENLLRSHSVEIERFFRDDQQSFLVLSLFPAHSQKKHTSISSLFNTLPETPLSTLIPYRKLGPDNAPVKQRKPVTLAITVFSDNGFTVLSNLE